MAMTREDCGRHGNEKKGLRLLAIGAAAAVFAIGLAALLLWLIHRPSKPQFYLQDYTLCSLSLTQQSCLSFTMQVTLVTRNPKGNGGIYYQKLDVFTTYRDQQVTLATVLPVGYLGPKESTVWSPYIIGNSEPISPSLANALIQDLNAGWLPLYVRVNGRLKWRVSTWMSSHHGVRANCPAYLSFGDHQCANNNNNNNNNVNGNSGGSSCGFGVKYQVVQDCVVELY